MTEFEEFTNFHELCEDYYISTQRVKEIERVIVNSRTTMNNERYYFIEVYFMAKAGQEQPDGVCITDGTKDVNSIRLQYRLFLTKLDKILNKINKVD